MFGHTFLRINSAYNSKLLSYALNYAADANPDTENAVVFAVKGLFGGYFGKYSMLPYYDKLKEYRDSEQRDIWEYDLDLSEEEVRRMMLHIWEVNDTLSYYYFFTQNCSYNMLWFLEVARESLHLREYFSYQVIPLESVHAANLESIIVDKHYRASKRTTILKYEELLKDKYIKVIQNLVYSKISPKEVLDDNTIEIQQKRYIFEAAIELLEYNLGKGKIAKDNYVNLFHSLSKARATLKSGESIHIETPQNPLDGHRAMRTSLGVGSRNGDFINYIGIRPAYHDLTDNSYGFMRGTQIEFLDFELSASAKEKSIEKATIISIASIAQQSKFFDLLSWRTKVGWDKNLLSNDTTFSATVGAGVSYGNKIGYIYAMLDPIFYIDNGSKVAIGGSFGGVIDMFDSFSPKFEYTRRFYEEAREQNIYNISGNFRTSQNTQIRLEYDFKNRFEDKRNYNEDNLKLIFNYYF